MQPITNQELDEILDKHPGITIAEAKFLIHKKPQQKANYDAIKKKAKAILKKPNPFTYQPPSIFSNLCPKRKHYSFR